MRPVLSKIHIILYKFIVFSLRKKNKKQKKVSSLYFITVFKKIIKNKTILFITWSFLIFGNFLSFAKSLSFSHTHQIKSLSSIVSKNIQLYSPINIYNNKKIFYIVNYILAFLTSFSVFIFVVLLVA